MSFSDVWSGPTHASQPDVNRVRPVRGQRKPEPASNAANKNTRAGKATSASGKKVAPSSTSGANTTKGKVEKGKKTGPGPTKKDDKSTHDKVNK